MVTMLSEPLPQIGKCTVITGQTNEEPAQAAGEKVYRIARGGLFHWVSSKSSVWLPTVSVGERRSRGSVRSRLPPMTAPRRHQLTGTQHGKTVRRVTGDAAP